MIEVLTTADIIEGIALLKLIGLWYNKQGKIFFCSEYFYENLNLTTKISEIMELV